MRQPIGLYLAEFVPDVPTLEAIVGVAGLPRFDAGLRLDDEDGPPVLPLETAGFDWPDGSETVTAEATDEPPIELPPPQPDTAAIVEALQADHAAALQAARQQWAEQEGAALARGLAAALETLEGRIAETLAPLLEPFLVQAAQMEALARLRAALGTLLDGGEAAITVSGPSDLLAAMRQGWADRQGLVFTESDAPDVTITSGETRIHSQLAGWARALETALGEPA